MVLVFDNYLIISMRVYLSGFISEYDDNQYEFVCFCMLLYEISYDNLYWGYLWDWTKNLYRSRYENLYELYDNFYDNLLESLLMRISICMSYMRIS